MRQATTLSEIEANRGICRCRRDIDRLCAIRHGDVGGNVPECLRGTSSAVGPRDVEESQPSEQWLKRGVDDRETYRPLPIERAEQDATACNDRLAERDLGGHTVRTRSSRIPPCNLGDRRRDRLQRAVNHAVLNVYVLGPVNRGDKRNVLRLQLPYLHEAHRLPGLAPSRESRRARRRPLSMRRQRFRDDDECPDAARVEGYGAACNASRPRTMPARACSGERRPVWRLQARCASMRRIWRTRASIRGLGVNARRGTGRP